VTFGRNCRSSRMENKENIRHHIDTRYHIPWYPHTPLHVSRDFIDIGSVHRNPFLSSWIGNSCTEPGMLGFVSWIYSYYVDRVRWWHTSWARMKLLDLAPSFANTSPSLEIFIILARAPLFTMYNCVYLFWFSFEHRRGSLYYLLG
jgi:hypothetical protein